MRSISRCCCCGGHAHRELARIHIPGLGAILTIVIVAGTGIFARNFFGAQLVELLERHPGAHPGGQLDLFERQADLRHSFLLQRPGLPQGAARAMAAPGRVDHRLPHGNAGGDIEKHLPADCVSVYVPTTPNPTSGYFVIVARKDVVELDMSVGPGAEIHHLDGRGAAQREQVMRTHYSGDLSRRSSIASSACAAGRTGGATTAG